MKIHEYHYQAFQDEFNKAAKEGSRNHKQTNSRVYTTF